MATPNSLDLRRCLSAKHVFHKFNGESISSYFIFLTETMFTMNTIRNLFSFPSFCCFAPHQQLDSQINSKKKDETDQILLWLSRVTVGHPLLNYCPKIQPVSTVHFVSWVYFSNNSSKSRVWLIASKVYRLQKAQMRLQYTGLKKKKWSKKKLHFACKPESIQQPMTNFNGVCTGCGAAFE